VPKPQEARVEWWMLGPRMARVESSMSRGSQRKSARWPTIGPRGGGRSDRPVWRSYCHPLFLGRSNCLGSWFDHQPLFWVWPNRPRVRSDHQQWPAGGGGPGVLVVVRAWEPDREYHPVERCLNHWLDEVRQQRETPPHKK
jgi:hypothetical protein